jgi:serine/threonine protein phosphatase PrpC
MSTSPLPAPPVRPGLRVTGSVYRSNIGRDRSANDDGLLAMNRTPLFAVCDGKGGPEAARTLLATLHERAAELSGRLRRAAEDAGASQRIAVERTLRRMFDLGNEALFTAGRAAGDKQFAATAVAATLAGYHAHVAHVGDARAYLYRRGTLRCLTSDHTVAAVQLRQGIITRTEYEMSPFRKTLAQAFGVTQVLETDVAEVRIVPGDRFFLCTNGVTRALAEDVIAAILGERDSEDAAEAISRRLREAGAPDNASFIIFDIDGPAATTLGPDEVEQRVRASFLLQGLTDSEWMQLSSCLETQDYAIGANIVRAGHPLPGLIVVGAGRVVERPFGTPADVPSPQPGWREYVPGDTFGALELSLPDGKSRLSRTDLIAVEPTVCMTLERARFREFLNHHPALGSALALRQLEHLGIGLAAVTATIGQIADVIQGKRKG